MKKIKSFKKEVEMRLYHNSKNKILKKTASDFIVNSIIPKYSYNFEWLGRPIIQYPQDMVALQEIIWKTKPDLIIETGIAHGGSLVYSASLLFLLDLCDSIKKKQKLNSNISSRRVLGIDIDIRNHNKKAINSHPMISKIIMIEGSSISQNTFKRVKNIAKNHQKILVLLDSNHTHHHVLEELNLYGPLVTKGSYCIVFDTIIEKVPKQMYPDRQWGPKNSPASAVNEFLKKNKNFKIDKSINNKILISVAPNGYLQKIK